MTGLLTETHLKHYVDVLMWGLQTARRGKYKKNDIILIRYDLAAQRLAELLFARVLEMGMHPVQRANASTDMERNFYGLGGDHQLAFIPPGDEELTRRMNGSIHLFAPDSLTHLSHVDATCIGKAVLARKFLRDISNEREAAGKYGWTLCMLPTPRLAKHAGLTPAEYAQQIVKACYLDQSDAVHQWQAVYEQAKALKNWLNRKKVAFFHIQSEQIDLEIYPGDQRRWVGISGHNIPSFELFLSPDGRRTRGRYYADQPSYRSGNYVTGVQLEFEKGQATKITAQTGEEFVIKQLAIDAGAGRVGEFSLTDKRFSRIDRFMANTLYDENFGGQHGNCHIALGASYSECYAGKDKLDKALKEKLGFNDSALHWDLVNTEAKRVVAHLKNGRRETIYENGRFAFSDAN